jgi:hypothetical protein
MPHYDPLCFPFTPHLTTLNSAGRKKLLPVIKKKIKKPAVLASGLLTKCFWDVPWF